MPPRGIKLIKTFDHEFGPLIRECRLLKNMTVKELARLSGLTPGFISQVERNITIPSLVSLQAIARVLDQRLSYFFERSFDDQDITRPYERLMFKPNGNEGVAYELVSADFPGSVMQSIILYQPPHFRSDPLQSKGEVLIFILEGSMTVEFLNKNKVLKAGESIHFDTNRVHSIHNHTEERTVSLWAGTLDILALEE